MSKIIYLITLLGQALSLFCLFFLFLGVHILKGRPGASGRVLPPVTGRSGVRVTVSSHCTGEGKACHWHPSPDPLCTGYALYIFWEDCNVCILFIYLYVFLSTLLLTTSPVCAVCNYPLSAACCLNRICSALEQKWNIRWEELLTQAWESCFVIYI